MSNKRVLIAEISGKRAGDSTARPTEMFEFDFDKVIISNNSEGYVTDWPIIDVPSDYQEWYKAHIKTNDKAFYAPMNRSYAIKYAREKGYDYLIQLDDNILSFGIRYMQKSGGLYATVKDTPHLDEVHNDILRYLITVLECTNAGIVGMPLYGSSVPSNDWLNERYVYSAFALNLAIIPDIYHGDFEDDIEFRLKLKEMRIPSIQVAPFRYNKTSQNSNNDLTGNRAAYQEEGLRRGETMSRIHGDIYSRGWSDRGSGTARQEGKKEFRHKLKPFKVGVRVRDYQRLYDEMMAILDKYATLKKDTLEVKINEAKTFYRVIITEESRRYSILSELMQITIDTDSEFVVPKTGVDYVIKHSGAKSEALERALFELMEKGGFEIDG